MTIKDAISLINDKTTTIDTICAMLYTHVEAFQQEREDFYLQEFEERVTENPDEFDSSKIAEYTDEIFKSIADDSKSFISEYTAELTDGLLDAINDKLVNKKACKLFLTILSIMEEVLCKAFNLTDD
jgi:hypothetical protein